MERKILRQRRLIVEQRVDQRKNHHQNNQQEEELQHLLYGKGHQQNGHASSSNLEMERKRKEPTHDETLESCVQGDAVLRTKPRKAVESVIKTVIFHQDSDSGGQSPQPFR